MSGYLQRMASSVLKPGGSIHPMLGSVFSASTYQGTRDDTQGEGNASSLIRPEFVTPPPTARISPAAGAKPGWSGSSVEPFPEERTSFQPLMNKSQQGGVEKPVVPSIGTNNEAGGWDKPEDVVSRNEPEIATPGGHASPIQSAGRRLDPSLSSVSHLPAMTSTSGDALRNESMGLGSEPRPSVGVGASVSTSNSALVTKAQPTDVERPEAAHQGRYQPLVPHSVSRIDHPMVFAERVSRLTPEIRKDFRKDGRKEEKSDLSHRSGSPERESDEIQIHIGRIEVTAMTQPAPRPLAAPVRKSPSLDEYLKRRDGRAG